MLSSDSQSEVADVRRPIPSGGRSDRKRNSDDEELPVRGRQVQGRLQPTVSQGAVYQVHSRDRWQSQSLGRCSDVCQIVIVSARM